MPRRSFGPSTTCITWPRLDRRRRPHNFARMDEDNPEAAELERVAEWRLRKADAKPSDEQSAKAARQLWKLAEDLRRTPNEKLLEEFRCVCNWLSESDGISDFVLRAQDYREMIAFGEWAETGDDYLRALIGLANETFGMG
jgi:hypothetical protein